MFKLGDVMNYSYLMGVKDITELKNNGFIVEEIDGNYGIKFEKDKSKFYEEFIIKNLEVGYWNEYLGDKIVFIFKFNDGSTKKYIYNKTNEEEILNLCCKFAECIFPSFKQMLEANSFYANNYFNKL